MVIVIRTYIIRTYDYHHASVIYTYVLCMYILLYVEEHEITVEHLSSFGVNLHDFHFDLTQVLIKI